MNSKILLAVLLAFSFAAYDPASRRGGGAAVYPLPAYTISSIAVSHAGFGNSDPAINNAGQVARHFRASPCMHAFLHTGDVLADLGMLPGGASCSYATAVNNRGDVALNKDQGRSSGDHTGFLYKDGDSRLTPLAPLPREYIVALAYGINDKRDIVGEAVITPPAAKTEAFLYIGGVFKRLGTLGGERASALDINNSDLIVGWSQTRTVPSPDDPRNNEWFVRPGHAFVYSRRDGMKDLNSVLPSKSELELRKANAISDQGHIVGFGYHSRLRTIRAFLMIHNHATDLGTFLPSGGMSYALAVNNRGEAVGAAYLDATGAGNFRACIFRGGAALNLNSMIDAPDWVLNEATGINDTGQIVGWGSFRGEYRVFLLTPIG